MSMLHFSASVLISLLSLSTAAPTTDSCSQLVQSLTVNELHQILGKWILIEGFTNNEILDSALENIKSMWLEVNTTADNQTLLFNFANRVVTSPNQPTHLGFKFANNVTLINGKVLEVSMVASSSNYKFLQTCPDCLLMHSYNKDNNYGLLYLFGRHVTISASDLETTRKQAACLQFHQPRTFHYNTIIELCQTPHYKRSSSNRALN